jgi:hypothetical protein
MKSSSGEKAISARKPKKIRKSAKTSENGNGGEK